MSRLVTFVQLHDLIHIPSIGQFDKSLKLSAKTLPNFKVSMEDNGNLSVTWTEGKYTKEFIVGAAMVKAAMFEPRLTDEEPSKPAKK